MTRHAYRSGDNWQRFFFLAQLCGAAFVGFVIWIAVVLFFSLG